MFKIKTVSFFISGECSMTAEKNEEYKRISSTEIDK